MLSGRCACKAVAYEVSDEFVTAYNCHCSNCRAMTGSAFLAVGQIERDKLTVTKGPESLRVRVIPMQRTRCAAASASHSSIGVTRTGRSASRMER